MIITRHPKSKCETARAGAKRRTAEAIPPGDNPADGGGHASRRSWWRRGESNPRPKSLTVRSLHAYPSSLLAFASGPQERATTNRRLAPAPRRALAQNPEAADPKPSRQSTPHIPHAGLKEETAT